MIQTQFQAKVKAFRTDNAREYFNPCFGDYFQNHDIIHRSSCLDIPHQTGVAERKNRHLLEVARSILFTMNVPKHFQGEAVLTATYLINRMSSRTLKFQTPIQALLQTFPNTRIISSLPPKIFGCTVFVHNHHKNKLDPKAIKCVFLGYSSMQKVQMLFSNLSNILCEDGYHIL